MASSLLQAFPWLSSPIIVSAPMLRISTAPLALAVSRAGGLGFLAAGYDVSDLESHLEDAVSLLKSNPLPVPSDNILPIGIGFLTWGASLDASLPLIQKYKPAAIWLFGSPMNTTDTTYTTWASAIRTHCSPPPAILIQTTSVSSAVHLARTIAPTALVLQGTDAGGHGAVHAASIVTLLPETLDALAAQGLSTPVLAAGGISDGRTAAASLCLGAAGCVMGTRFLAAREAAVAGGYQAEILRAADGGVSTVRSTVYDRVRGIEGWPAEYDGRGVINASWRDAVGGMADEENRRLYEEEMEKGPEGGWGVEGRMTTYAGTGVGLVRGVKGAGEIVEEVREGAKEVLRDMKESWM